MPCKNAMTTLCYLERDNSYLMLHRVKNPRKNACSESAGRRPD